jgi:chromosome segregation and condensation protein ScpB
MQVQRTSRAQRAVLGLVLYEDPSPVRFGDLRQEIGEDADQAVAELVAVGLLARDGAVVRATPAAVHFDALRLP